MISGARQYSQRDRALSLTKARVALVTNASRQAGLHRSLSRIDVCARCPYLLLYRPTSPVLNQRSRIVQTYLLGLVNQPLQLGPLSLCNCSLNRSVRAKAALSYTQLLCLSVCFLPDHVGLWIMSDQFS